MQKEPLIWLCRKHRFTLDQRPLIMGVLNVTRDSFYDGGRFYQVEKAVEHGLLMVAEGADIIDVGGESSRPGSVPVSVEDEISRVVPVVEALSRETQAAISVDTSKSAVAQPALAAGADIVNDITALTADPAMPAVVKGCGAGAILMHMQGEPRTMQANPVYSDVVNEVNRYLQQRVEALVGQGLDRQTLAIDPGIGFGKTAEHNMRLITRLDVLRNLKRPIVVGLSRKRFLGYLTGHEVEKRLAASLGALAFALFRGAHIFRVHDVSESRDVLQVIAALMQMDKR